MGDPTEKSGVNGEAVTATGPVPILGVARDELTFILDGVTIPIRLKDLAQGAIEGSGPVGLLLYAIVLKLHDVDVSLKKAVANGENAAQRIHGMETDPMTLIEGITKHLEKLGLAKPEQDSPAS